MLEWAPNAEVGTTEREAEVISGRRGMDPPSNPVIRFLARNARPPTAPVGRVLREGDLVSGFRVIATPGHTSGHASLLRDEDGLLFTADAFGVLLRRIRAGVYKKAPCTDPAEAKRSAQKLLAEDFGVVLMAHVRPLYSGAREQLREAVDRCDYA